MPNTTYKIRVWRDGAGYWSEIRDHRRNVIRTTWGIGSKAAALDDARRAVANLATKGNAA